MSTGHDITMKVVGLGDPVMDIVAHVSHDYLAAITEHPGGCVPISSDVMQAMLLNAEADGKQLLRCFNS